MIVVQNISKSYWIDNKNYPVLKDVNFSIQKGEFVSLIGKSGSGKSTLLNIIGLLDLIDSGNLIINSIPIKDMSETELSIFRGQYIGFVFQSFHLIQTKTAIENVALPLFYQKIKKNKRIERAIDMLIKVGLGDRLHHYPNQLSGGQQQRVAIARALVANPEIILADEPTGALDSETSEEIMNLLMEINNEGKTILIITHENDIARRCKRIIKIKDGQI